MAKKKPARIVKVPAAQAAAPMPVLHGDVFRAFLDEARSVGNELVARREFCSDVVEYLKQKGLFEEWGAWREQRRAPKS